MLSTSRTRRGYAFIGILMALAIVFILTQGYFSTDTPDGKPFAISTTDRARQAVANINFRTAQTQWMMVSEGNRLEINRLRQEMDSLSTRMGSGGRFFVDSRNQLCITTNLATPKYADQFPLPKIR